MKDYCAFTDLDFWQFDSYSGTGTKNATCLPDGSELYPSGLPLRTANYQDLDEQTNGGMNVGLEHMDFPNVQHRADPNEGKMYLTTSISAPVLSNSGITATFKRLEELKPGSSSQLLRRLEDKKLNLILLATSEDKDKVMKELEGTLDSKTCRMIPLSFRDDASEHLTGVEAQEPENDWSSVSSGSTDENSGDDTTTCNGSTLKRKHSGEKDEKYWKRRNSNNEAAKRSREAKRVRFAWIENRTKELELENARLEEQLRTLQSKVSSLQGRPGKLSNDDHV